MTSRSEAAAKPAAQPLSPAQPSSASQQLGHVQSFDPTGAGHSSRQVQRHLWPWLVVLAVAGAGAYVGVPKLLPLLAASSAKPTVAPVRLVPILTAQARQQDLSLYLNGLGTVTAFYTVTLHCRVDGELMKVQFSEGQLVRKGDLLAEIDPRPFEVQLLQAEGNLTKDEAALRVAQLDLERYTALASSRSITQQQLDAQKALVQQSEGAIQTDRAQIDNAKLQLTYCKIISPIDGRIGLRLVDPGNIVHAGDLTGLAVITQLQPIALVFTVPQDEIWRVQQKVKEGSQLVVEAHDRDFAKKLATGRLLAIDNQVDATTGTVRLKAVFDNEEGMLFPNQFVNARLHIDTLRKATVVPGAAVQRGPNSMFVYVVKEGAGKDSTAVELRNVTIGPSEGDLTTINSGLNPGEIVVTDGVDKLQSGSKVVVRQRQGTQPELAKPSTPPLK